MLAKSGWRDTSSPTVTVAVAPEEVARVEANVVVPQCRTGATAAAGASSVRRSEGSTTTCEVALRRRKER